MCGLCGVINLNNKTPISDVLINMTNSMRNRGPNDEGFVLIDDTQASFCGDNSINKELYHIKTSLNHKTKIGFGFRQLKIIDLSNKSHQPMCDINQNYLIVFNGEVYNFKEIREELISLGYSFFSNSDTEVILNAYKEWNVDALQKFNGMFAIVIYDKINNEIFLARDRMGIKPLYIYQNKDQFVFASTMKAIIDSGIYTSEINWEGLWQNFRFSIAQRPNTCFRNINALEPAHYLKINLNNNTFVKKQYWELPVNTQDFSLTEKKSIKIIEEGLFNAVNYRLKADVEVGTFMSGGIDSTTIAVMASKINPDIKALTLGFKDYEKYNEVNQASDTANLNNLNHIIQNIHSSEIIKNIEQIVTAYEEPYRNLSANYMLANMASNNNLKVILSGLGGDELFGGYDVYNKLKYWNFLKSKKLLISRIPKFHTKIKKAVELSEYTDLGQFYSHYYTLYNDVELSKLFQSHQYDTKNTISNIYNKNKLKFTDDFEAISFYNLKSYIGNHQLRAVDNSTMNFSVEGRLPLLDHNFIEIAYKIPSKYKIKNNIQKYILKQVAKKYIAPSCLSMQKKGLSLPLEHWISKELKEFVNDSILKLKNRNIFNNAEIDNILKSGNKYKIWQLVSTENWIDKFISN